MSYLFPPDKSLLYPQFETYRLQPLSPDDNLLEYPLPDPGSTQSRVGYNTSSYLSFKEVRNRIGWDHLVLNEDGVGVYVDRDWGVVGFVILDDLQPTFSKLASLPQPISSSSKDQQSEFPSVLPLTNSTWAVSSGSGSLYILETTQPDASNNLKGKFVARYDLRSSSSTTGSNEPSPFLLRASHKISDRDIKLLLTRSVKSVEGKKSIRSSQQTTFELIEVTVDPTSHNPVDEQEVVEKLRISWTLTGEDLPIHCSYDTEHDGWIVLCPEEFKAPSPAGNKEESEVDREKREREEKIGKLGLGASLPPQTPDEQMEVEGDEAEEEKLYPYKWTQDSESINMIIPLPESTTRQDINLTLTSTTLSLSLPSSTNLSSQLTQLLAKQARTLWTNIDPELSTWTYDSQKSQIELDLVKIDHNVRWPSIFSSEDDEDEEEEVPETLSASTLAAVRESFNSIKRRESGDPPSAHPAMPALLREEMDFDLDDEDDPMAEGQGMYDETGKIGKEVFVGFIQKTPGQDTPKVNWSKTTTSVLSLPLSQSNEGIIIKSAVDGLLFHPGTQEMTKHPWRHLSTNPALAFVLSSKRDLRLIKHFNTSSREAHPHENVEPSSPSSSKRLKPSSAGTSGANTTVLAFDSGSSVGQGNLYVYYPPVPGDRNTARQGVIPVSGGDKGALLGVGHVKVGERDLVVVLTEKSLVVVKNVI